MSAINPSTENAVVASDPTSDIASPIQSIVNSLESLKLLVAISIPVGIGVAAIHELAFFDAIGLPVPWQFAAIVPIPLMELLRVALWSALFTAFLFTITIALYYFFVTIWHVFSVYFNAVKNTDSGISPFGEPPVWFSKYVNALALGKCAKTIQSGKEKFLLKLNAERSQAAYSLIRIFIVLGTITVLFQIALPFGSLLMAYVSPRAPLVDLVVKLVVTVLSLAGVMYSILWSLGLSKGQVFVYGRSNWRAYSALSIGIFLSAYELGYNSGLEIVESEQGKLSENNLVKISGAVCMPLTNPQLLRSYSNGYLLFSTNQLGWLPVEKGACWSIPLRPKQFRIWTVTPTFLDQPIDSFSFRVKRSYSEKY